MAVDVCVCAHHRGRHFGAWNGPKGPCKDCPGFECPRYKAPDDQSMRS